MQLSAHHGILKFVKIGTLYVFHFASSISEANNKTFPVYTHPYNSSTPGMITGYKGNSKLINESFMQSLVIGISSVADMLDPYFGPWNSVQCRDSTVLTLKIGDQNNHGIIIAVDIYYPGSLNRGQTILSIRNQQNGKMVFTVEISPSSKVAVWTYNTSWTKWFESLTPLIAGKSPLKLYCLTIKYL